MNHPKALGLTDTAPAKALPLLAFAAGLALTSASISAWAAPADEASQCERLLTSSATHSSTHADPATPEAAIADAWAQLLAPQDRAHSEVEIAWLTALASSSDSDLFAPPESLFNSSIHSALEEIAQITKALIDTEQVDASRLRQLILTHAAQVIDSAQQGRESEQDAKEARIAVRLPVRVLEGHQGRVFGASFSPDGSMIVSASSDNTARIWDLDHFLGD